MSVKRINTTVKMNVSDGEDTEFKTMLLLAGDCEDMIVKGQGTYDAIGAAAKALVKLSVLVAPPTADEDWAWTLAGEIIETAAEAEAERENRKLRWSKVHDQKARDIVDKMVNSARLNKNKPEIHCPYCEATIEADEDEAEGYLDGGFQICPECGKEFYLESAEKYEWTTRQLDGDGNPLRF